MDVVSARAICIVAALMYFASSGAQSADGASFCGTAQWQPFIAEAALRFELPEQWLHAVMRVESAGCTQMNDQPTISSAGAMGLMQLMPTVWAQQRERLQLGDDPHNPRDNILAGAAYLRDLYDRYGWPGAAAAYHAGPKRYEDARAHAKPLPNSTLVYLRRIEKSLSHEPNERSPRGLAAGEESTAPASETDGLFVTQSASKSTAKRQSQALRSDGLFVGLRHGNSQSTSDTSEPEHVQQQ